VQLTGSYVACVIAASGIEHLPLRALVVAIVAAGGMAISGRLELAMLWRLVRKRFPPAG